jgi:hypothetical protein
VQEAGSVWLNEQNCLYAEMKRDLAREGLLTSEYQLRNFINTSTFMHGNSAAGKGFVARNYPRYNAAQKDLLTLKPFDQYRMLDDGGLELVLEMDTASVTAVRLKF